MRLAGRVALVTGASGGLGAAICLELARDGASDDARFICGETLVVDGGTVMRL